jgi:hypothetical protein
MGAAFVVEEHRSLTCRKEDRWKILHIHEWHFMLAWAILLASYWGPALGVECNERTEGTVS